MTEIITSRQDGGGVIDERFLNWLHVSDQFDYLSASRSHPYCGPGRRLVDGAPPASFYSGFRRVCLFPRTASAADDR